MQGVTPGATGSQPIVVTVPHSPDDGTTVAYWTVRRLYFRVEGAASGTATIQVERSAAGNTAFAVVNSMVAGGLSITGTSNFENFAVGGGLDITQVASGEKLRVNVTSLGAQTNWSVAVLLVYADTQTPIVSAA